MTDQNPKQDNGLDRAFKAIHDDEVPWENGLDNNLLTLPPGIQVKIFAKDDAMKRVDMKVKFPPGYVEPEHSHKSWHSIVVLKGRMCVAGKDLRPGDYAFGWDVCMVLMNTRMVVRSSWFLWVKEPNINGAKKNTLHMQKSETRSQRWEKRRRNNPLTAQFTSKRALTNLFLLTRQRSLPLNSLHYHTR